MACWLPDVGARGPRGGPVDLPGFFRRWLGLVADVLGSSRLVGRRGCRMSVFGRPWRAGGLVGVLLTLVGPCRGRLARVAGGSRLVGRRGYCRLLHGRPWWAGGFGDDAGGGPVVDGMVPGL